MSQPFDFRVVIAVLSRIGVNPKAPSAKALESADAEKFGRFSPEVQAQVVLYCVQADKRKYQSGPRRHQKK